MQRMEKVKKKRGVPSMFLGMLLLFFLLPVLKLYLLPFLQVERITDSSTIVKQPQQPLDPFQIQPQCSILKRLIAQGNITTSQDLSMDRIFATFGKYVNASNPNPRYDHESCFFMKPRYNCGNDYDKGGDKTETKATDYALALTNGDGDNITICDLQQFIADAGGVAGVGRQILENFQQQQQQQQDKKDKPNVVKVVIAGISLHRQVFEALSCGFRDTLSDFKVLRNKDATKKHISLVNYKFEQFQTNKRNGVCYDRKQQQPLEEEFYGYVLEAPKNHDKCTDDLGIAEFKLDNSNNNNNKIIRFYYLYRPWQWLWKNRNLDSVFDAMGLGDHKDHPDRQIDFLFTDGGQHAKGLDERWKDASIFYDYFQIRNTTIHATTTNNNNNMVVVLQNPNHLFQNLSVGVDFEDEKTMDFLDQYRLLQLRDLGRWYGATNSRNPSGDPNHGCMPGPPDDKANFLLWYMLSLSELQ